MMNKLIVRSTQREECIEITGRVSEILRAARVSEGACIICCFHTTAGIFINENADPDVADDVLAALDALVPHGGAWKHVEGNTPAHVKAILTGSSVVVPISEGVIQLGRWQGVFLAEFDGPRKRLVSVQIVS